MVTLPDEQVISILTAIDGDTDFLTRNGIIDYSLLLVVETLREPKSGSPHSSQNTRNKYHNGKGTVYHFGIIDYLQGYNLSKKAERCFKMTKSLG